MKKNKQKIDYNGSLICLISSHLFLIAALFNLIYCKNYIEGVLIYFIYITSIFYHYNGNKYMRNIDILTIRITCLVCLITSLIKQNILPALIGIFVIFFYYINLSNHPLYHALTVHLIGFFSFIALYFNNKKYEFKLLWKNRNT